MTLRNPLFASLFACAPGDRQIRFAFARGLLVSAAMKRLVLMVLTVLMPLSATHARELTLERIFSDPSLDGPAPRALQLSPDGRYATYLRNREEDAQRYDLWAVDAETGEARMLIDSEALGTGAALSEEELMRRERARLSGVRGIVTYQWAPDASAILVPLDGDLYLAGLDGDVRQLTDSEESELDARLSETGRYVSFVRDGALHVIGVDDGESRQITPDGSETVSWGVAEFVAQEEMDRDTGHWWSPDDRHVAVARVDESPVEIVTRTAIGAEGTRVFEQRYPLAGTANARIGLFVLSPDGERRVEVDLGEDEDIYLARVDWTADGGALLVQRQNRSQQRLDMLRVDPETGRSELLFGETSESWLNLHNNLRALDDGRLIWTSERDGHSHIYLWDEGDWQQLTSGAWQVDEVRGVDQARGRVYFTGNRETPLERHLYWVSLDGGGEPRRLTEAGWWNDAVVSKGGESALVNRSNGAQPPQVYLADSDGERIAWIEENRIDADHPYAPYLESHVEPEFGTIAASDGTALYYEMLSPEREPGRRYPVFVQVYGGPGAGRQARQGWTGAFHQYLVDRGWIVFSIDGRGSPDRGKAFEDHIFRAMGGVEVEDQLTGLDWLQAQDFVDAERIGVYGWSYGGYMVLRLLQAAPGRFAAGVSGAPVTRWELYDTHYTERYLGNPAIDPEPYERSSALAGATAIADPLLLVHGMADDNVVFEHSTVLMGLLQGESIPFETMIYPGATHSLGSQERRLHMWRVAERFLDRTVRGETR